MASVINVTTLSNPRGLNVLAADTAAGSALNQAIAEALREESGAFMGASTLGGRPIDVIIPAAVAPATDGGPKAIYSVSFQAGSGPNGGTPAPTVVLAWPQTSGAVTTPAPALAAQAAASQASAAVSQVTCLGTVDLDITAPGAAPPQQTSDLTKYAFLSLFTQDELASVLASADPGVKTFVFMFENAEDIQLTDPRTIGGVNYLATAAPNGPGLLTAARAAQILANMPCLTVTAPTITAVHGAAIAPINAVANGGSAAGYVYTATGLPAGLAISTAGLISGTPTTPGSFTYTVSITDSEGDTATATGAVTVN